MLSALLLTCCSSESEANAQDNQTSSNITQKTTVSTIRLYVNSSGGFEIWGALGFSLPTSNTQITAQPGDVIL